MFSVTRSWLLKDHGARCGAPVAVRRPSLGALLDVLDAQAGRPAGPGRWA